MPNPNFLPAIASGFDALAGQAAHFAGFNESVDEGNLARLAAAQQQRNNWLAQVNTAQRQDAARQDQAEMNRIGLLQAAAQQAEGARRFEVGTGLEREKMANRLKEFDLGRDYTNAQERKMLDTIEAAGNTMDADAGKLGAEYEKSQAAYNEAQQAVDRAAANSAPDAKPGSFHYDKATKQYAANILATDDDKKAIEAANEKFANLRADHDAATINAKNSASTWANFEKNVRDYQLLLQKQGDRWRVFSPQHRRFLGKEPEAAPKEGPLSSTFDTSKFDAMFGGASAPATTGTGSALGLSGIGAEPDTSTETAPPPPGAGSAWGSPATYTKPEDVRTALRAGRLTKDVAAQILETQFGFSRGGATVPVPAPSPVIDLAPAQAPAPTGGMLSNLAAEGFGQQVPAPIPTPSPTTAPPSAAPPAPAYANFRQVIEAYISGRIPKTVMNQKLLKWRITPQSNWYPSAAKNGPEWNTQRDVLPAGALRGAWQNLKSNVGFGPATDYPASYAPR
jgi:hypothetical protein